MHQREEWLDFIKVFGVLATLFLHSNATLVNFQTSVVSSPVELNMFYWKISVVFASLAGPSFALIFMYLGAILLNSTQNSFRFYLSRAKQLFVPLIIWSTFALLFQKYIMHWNIDILQKISHIIITPVANNLMILYFLIIVFIFTPILRKILDAKSNKQRYIIGIIWLSAVSGVLSLQQILDIHIPILIFMSIAYLGFMQLGFLLSKVNLNRQLLTFGIGLFLLGNLWTIFGTLHYSNQEQIAHGVYANYFFNRISIPMVLSSTGFFIILRYLAEHSIANKYVKSTIQRLSAVALGICMVYPYWFVFLGTKKIGIELTAFSGNPLWSVPLLATITIVGSFMTVYFLTKVPHFKHIFPRLV